MQTLRRDYRRAGGGFTLIELLVVIAIIAVLIGILLPSLASARNAARQTACMSTSRQIGTAMMMYADQYKDYIPREGTAGLTPDTLRSQLPWAILLRPFLDQQVGFGDDPNDLFENAPYYRCPSYPKGNSHRVHYVSNGFRFVKPGVAFDGSARPDMPPRGTMRLHEVMFPAKTMFLAEFADDLGDVLFNRWVGSNRTDLQLSQFYDVWLASQLAEGGLDYRIGPKRHGTGATALYMDGHAAQQPSAFFANANSWDDGRYLER